ncbi:DUF4157 domain-containing protein [Coleofasciculus sp. FACHB-1120]|uniref:eCIS core domain-containing protein n=1 Tax=Coleofasciculus sp. FACHB-1120 TaxID=2692783 RepID=UPI0016891E29|nr:DUF4157 domain-containing protein [Coleofasciculus sp. FACHB-1120]MBD2745014.1 DUF4157 domain-containing protein [Coleofasciculus sp. FACHB-1120]
MSKKVEAQVKTSSTPTTATTPVQPQFQQRSFSSEVEPVATEQVGEQPDLQTQLDKATCFGHYFGRVKVYSDLPQVIQPKLVIGPPGDKYEQEADQVAARVMAMPNPVSQLSAQRQPSEESKSPLTTSILRTAQRQEPQQPIQRKSLLQRRVQSDGSHEATSEIETQLNKSQGSGSPLPNEVRSFMEPRFGADFSSVRVHTGGEAVQMNRELGAQAFTHGSDVYFGAGKSPGNNELMAHELTHVVQQTGETQLNTKLQPICARIQRGGSNKPAENKLFFTRPVTEDMLSWAPEELAAHMFSSVLNRSKDYVREQMKRDEADPLCIRLIGDWGVTPKQLAEKEEFSFFLEEAAYYAHRGNAEGTEDLARDEHGQAEGYDEREAEFNQLPAKDQSEINLEANWRYWKDLGDKNQTKIKKGEESKSRLWLNIRDELLYQREQIQNLPDKVKLILRPEGNKVIAPKDYEQVIRIGRKIMTFDDLDLSTYLQRNLAITDDWNTLEKSIDRFLAFKAGAKEKISDVMELVKDEDWGVDEETEKLSLEEMRYLSLQERLKLIDYISNGTLVLDDDEQTLIKLIASTPTKDGKALLESFKKNHAGLLKRLESAIDGQENKEYNGALRNIFFQGLNPEEAIEAMEKAKIFPWADPGLIKATYNVRFYYEDVELTDDGQLKVTYWINLVFGGMKTTTQYLDPYEVVGVHFFMDEEFADTKKGNTIYMPAINLISLKNKQLKTEFNAAVDVTLLFAGGVGLAAKGTRLAKAVAALDLTLGTAGIVINDFRSEIGSTEAGKKFLKAWDIANTAIAIYGITRVVVELPNTIRNLRTAYQEFRQAANSSLSPDNLKNLDTEANTLFKKADEAIEEAGKAPKSSGTEPSTLKPAETLTQNVDEIRANLRSKLPDEILRKLSDEDLKALNLLDQQALQELRGVAKSEDISKLTQLIRQDSDLANRLLREAPFEDVKAFSERFSRAQKRVTEPVEGLYASVNADNVPANWNIQTKVQGNKLVSTVKFTKADGSIENGQMTRSYDPNSGTFVMEEAFLDKLPSFIESGIPMVKKKGTPLVTFLTIHQMKKFGIAIGSIKKVKMSTIQNFETILHLHWLRKKYPGKSIDELIMHSHSVNYAETSIVQSGHKIVGTKVGGTQARTRPVGSLMEHYETHDPRDIAKHDALLKKYGFERTESMYMNFDIELHLAPAK